MKNFAFSIPTIIQYGPGSSLQAGFVLKQFVHPKKSTRKPHILVIIDPGVRSAIWLVDILKSIKGAGIEQEIFGDVKPNPRDVDIQKAAALIKTQKLGAVIAIGGGSTIDTAKGCALLASYGGNISDYPGWGNVPGPVLPVIAIPTTAGSGSEATCWAVITDTTSHQKLAIGDPHLAPAAALVDPLLTLALPPALTAATGMDALTHSIEAYVGALSNPINDLLALESIRLVAAYLNRAVQDGSDLEAREGMMLASTLGGVAINSADVAGVHCVSEGMGSLYDAPHGLLNAILLPYFMAYWLEGCSERFARIAVALGGESRPEDAVKIVLKLVRSLNFPALKDIGVKEEDLYSLAALAEGNVSNTSNPIPMTLNDYLHILNLAYAGKPPEYVHDQLLFP